MRERRHVAARRAQAEQRAFRGGARRRYHVAGRPDGAAGAQPKGVTLPRSASARPQSARSFLEAAAAAPAVTPLSDRTAIALNSEAALTSFSTKDNVARSVRRWWLDRSSRCGSSIGHCVRAFPGGGRVVRTGATCLLPTGYRLRIGEPIPMIGVWALAAPPGVALRRSWPRHRHRRPIYIAG